MRPWAAVVLALISLAPGCTCDRGAPWTGGPAGQDAAPAEPHDGTSGDLVALDFLTEVPRCAVLHRGVLLDLGSEAAEGRFDYAVSPPADITNVQLEGSTWARVAGRRLTQRFVINQASPVFVQARVRGGSARAFTVMLDDKAVGTLRLPRGDNAVVSTALTADPIAEGEHVVSLQFHGARKGQVVADVDWIRIGTPDSDPTTYAAPTQRDLVIDTTIRGEPRRALAMRAPGAVRCQVAVPERAVLRAIIGYTGPGEGEAEVLIHHAGELPAVLQTAKVGGESEAAVDVEIPLDGEAGKVLDIELRATRSSPGGRVLFGEPALHLPRVTLPPREPAQVAIVLVLSGAAPAHLPPYSDAPALATLTDLAAAGAAFRHHRTNTTLGSGSMASLLTGLPPMVHQVVDTGARLPERTPTLGTMARDGRVTTAMFTGNPTTFQAFGFDRGWDRYLATSPVSGASPRAPMIEATKWLEKRLEEAREGRLLAVIHARGVHPPWSATSEETRNLPPEEYAGPIEARRGAQILATARHRANMRLKPADRERIDSFCSLALVGEDQSLSQLIAVLRKARVWDKTLLVVTSDVAMGSPSRVPFGDGDKLGEDLLDLPLLVRFPGQRHAGKVISSPTSPADLATTVLASLQLKPPDGSSGRDLFELATHPGRFPMDPQIAILGASYATRFGDFLLQGNSPKAPSLCDLAVDPGCATDVAGARPLLAAFLWRATYLHFRESANRSAWAREPATLDPDTVAALTVWGNMESK